MKDVIKKVVNGKYGRPVVSYKLTYDSPQGQLESTYYWILDFMRDLFGGDVKKIIDNFMSSPGSGHFSDMNQRVSKLQDDGMKILGSVNQVIKSALNLIYDLREFKERLQHYKDANSDKPELKKAATLALKNVWLDSVDLPKRQNGSIHQMTAQLGYVTLRDAFMSVGSLKEIDDMVAKDDINESVAKILRPRYKEFCDWVLYSQKELQKRYNIEKSYLKNQVETIKLYSSWVKPYLVAAKQLQQKGFENDAALVDAFATSMFQLTLFAKKEAKLPDNIAQRYQLTRKYYSCAIIDFKQRSQLLQRVTQKGDYAPTYGGRLEITFDAYALNSEELELINKTMEKDDLNDLMSFDSNLAEDALRELKEDIDEFLNDKEEIKKEEPDKKEKEKQNDINPFAALFGFSNPKKTKKSVDKKEINSSNDIASDNWYEKYARMNANNDAGSKLYTLYDIYKKSHGMASAPDPFDKGEQSEEKTTIKDALKDAKR